MLTGVTHSLTHSLTRSLTHSLTHSLAQSTLYSCNISRSVVAADGSNQQPFAILDVAGNEVGVVSIPKQQPGTTLVINQASITNFDSLVSPAVELTLYNNGQQVSVSGTVEVCLPLPVTTV
jgi:hypothetical protein